MTYKRSLHATSNFPVIFRMYYSQTGVFSGSSEAGNVDWLKTMGIL
jgi:hypothetical protein